MNRTVVTNETAVNGMRKKNTSINAYKEQDRFIKAVYCPFRKKIEKFRTSHFCYYILQSHNTSAEAPAILHTTPRKETRPLCYGKQCQCHTHS